jgi:hypothetical protein
MVVQPNKNLAGRLNVFPSQREAWRQFSVNLLNFTPETFGAVVYLISRL